MSPERQRSEAILFPGQGSQTPGMRELVRALRPDLLELAVDAVGADPFDREGTRYTQPAIFCAALAGWESLRGNALPLAMAGHSLGEIPALVAAGGLGEEDGMRLVAARGRLMQEAAERGSTGGMLAVLGDRGDAFESVVTGHGLTLANDNSPTQAVLSGPLAGIEEAEPALRRLGLRTRLLPVAGAFHSVAIAAAEAPFREVLRGLAFREPCVPVLSCVTAARFTDPVEQLAAALTSPVRWHEVMLALRAAGAERFLEVGPGKVLTNLARRSFEGVEAIAPVKAEAIGV